MVIKMLGTLLVVFFAIMGSMYTSGIIFLTPLFYKVEHGELSPIQLLWCIPIWIAAVILYALLHPLYLILFLVVATWAFVNYTKGFLVSMVLSGVLVGLFYIF